jgi:hypothetical protein
MYVCIQVHVLLRSVSFGNMPWFYRCPQVMATVIKDYLNGPYFAKTHTVLYSTQQCPVQSLHRDYAWVDSHKWQDVGGVHASALSAIYAAEDGTRFRLVPRSHTLLSVDIAQEIELELPRGSVLVFHALLAHSGAAYAMPNIRFHSYIITSCAYDLFPEDAVFRVDAVTQAAAPIMTGAWREARIERQQCLQRRKMAAAAAAAAVEAAAVVEAAAAAVAMQAAATVQAAAAVEAARAKK